MRRRLGIHGAGVIPTTRAGGPKGSPPLDFDFDTFTAGMAKRGGTGVFAAAPIVQGQWDGSGTPDVLSLSRGSLFGNPVEYTYDNFDPAQGEAVCWWTPERDSGAGATTAYVWYISAAYYLAYNYTTGTFTLCIGTQTMTRAQAATAGTAILVTAGWDTQKTLDGTNYARIGTNDTFSYGITTQPTLSAPAATMYLGSNGTASPINAIGEGVTWYRRPLWNGSYGVPVAFDDSGPVDELAAIYAAGAGADPCLTTGSWDVAFCLPTDSSEEALVTGTGEAWSHPHSSNVLEHWTLEDGFYGGGQWAVAFDGSATNINCGSAAALDDLADNEFTVDAWVRADSWGLGNIFGTIAQKGLGEGTGWQLTNMNTGGNVGIVASVNCATTDAASYTGVDDWTPDGKWHHVTMYFNDAGDRKIYIAIDGRWVSSYSTQTAGVGAIVSDAAEDFTMGARTSGSAVAWDGCIGWVRISDNDRHSHGTDFIPPREFPAADGNTVEAWSLNDGSGGTAAAQVTSPGNDGTITSGTWEQQWDDVGTPVYPTVLEFDGSATLVNCGSAADIDDLADNAFTAELWFRQDVHETAQLFSKRGGTDVVGWQLITYSGNGLQANVFCATTHAQSRTGLDDYMGDGKWHHVAMFFDDAGDRKIYLAIDGVWITSYTDQTAGVGAIVSDAAKDLTIGDLGDGQYEFDGAMGFVRISDNDRYTHTNKAFVPPSRANPPAPDGNTLRQFNFTDGAGTTLTDATGTANGTITMGSGRWYNWPDMETTAQGSRIYQWGYVIGSDGADDGVHQHLAGLSAGENYVVRLPLRYEADKRAQPHILIYDETNGANITDFLAPFLTGTHDGGNNQAALSDSTAPYWPYSLVGGTIYNITDSSSATITAAGNSITGALAGGTDNDWDNGDVYFIVPPTGWVFCEPFCFELPTIARNGAAADCAEISVRLLNGAGDGVIYWEQVELLENVYDNPSVETGAGNPWIPDGWLNVDLIAGELVQELAIIHSGASSLEMAGVHAHQVSLNNGTSLWGTTYPTGTFMAVGCWLNTPDAFMWHGSNGANAYRQRGTTFQTTSAIRRDTGSIWRSYAEAIRVRASVPSAGVPRVGGLAAGAGASRYIDDLFCFPLDDVTLTVTPANQANSTETSGLRVDGQDLCSWTPPVGRLLAAQGWLRWNATARHDAADLAAFAGAGNLPYLVYIFGNANNNIIVEVTAANTIQLDVTANAVNATQNWDCTGAIVAGTTYKMEVRWDGNWFRFYVDDILVAQVTVGPMTTDIATVYWGCDATPAHEADMTYASP